VRGDVTAVAAPDSVMFLAGFSENPNRRGPRGFDPPEVEPAISNDAGDVIRVYELQREASGRP
jgi:hypothetical protein